MAARLRVPTHSVRHHARRHHHHHHEEEGYELIKHTRHKQNRTDSITAASFLEPLKGGKVPLEVLVRGKDADENAKQMEQCIDLIKKAGVSGHLRTGRDTDG